MSYTNCDTIVPFSIMAYNYPRTLRIQAPMLDPNTQPKELQKLQPKVTKDPPALKLLRAESSQSHQNPSSLKWEFPKIRGTIFWGSLY